MTRIDVIIPTRGRRARLERTLKSIPKEAEGIEIKPLVVFDGASEAADFKAIAAQGYEAILFHQHQGAVRCRNQAMAMTEDAIIYATDDIVFQPGSIAEAIRTFKAKFPDDDGAVGFAQIGSSFHPSGIALVGKTFLARYPKRALFFEGYFHFACQEVYELAHHLGRWAAEPKAVVMHYHPDKFPAFRDKTHVEARIHRQQDLDLAKKRKMRGQIWGL
jgi:glycosyltransferase involved in cell wall biosynthesis